MKDEERDGRKRNRRRRERERERTISKLAVLRPDVEQVTSQIKLERN